MFCGKQRLQGYHTRWEMTDFRSALRGLGYFFLCLMSFGESAFLSGRKQHSWRVFEQCTEVVSGLDLGRQRSIAIGCSSCSFSTGYHYLTINHGQVGSTDKPGVFIINKHVYISQHGYHWAVTGGHTAPLHPTATMPSVNHDHSVQYEHPRTTKTKTEKSV